MSLLDPYFAQLREYQSALIAKGRNVHVFSGSLIACPPLEPSNRAVSPFVLNEDTAVELGGPRTTCTSFVMWTQDPGLLVDARVTLIGPDIPHLFESSRSPAAFGQAILIAGPLDSSGLQLQVEREQHTATGVPGYMARGTGTRIWSRVSREACNSGFSLGLLGLRMISHIRRVPSLKAVEIVFVTSCRQDVEELQRIGEQVTKLSHDLRRHRLRRADDGVYECQSDASCTACPDSEVCAEIRQILVIRKRTESTSGDLDSGNLTG